MEQLKVTGFDLTHMCRLCLTSDVSNAGTFLFSIDLGKTIADIVMECVPVQVTRHDKMPTYICRLCFTQLKKFHQFQMQALQSDKTLKRYLQQLSDCHPQNKVQLALEELSDNIENQNSTTDVSIKREPFEIVNEFDIPVSKQNTAANFSSGNETDEDLYLKFEPEDELISDNTFNSTACADAIVENLAKSNSNETIYEDSMIEIEDMKIGVVAPEIFGALKMENGITQKMAVKSEEGKCYTPLIDASKSLCLENIKGAECLRFYKDKMNRNRHKLKYTGEKPYQCDICKMCFRQPQSLKRHNLLHTGEKPYQCDICKMRFSESGNLKKHSTKHTGEKPYQCDVCNMYFRLAVLLKSHKLKHTGEKPYKCDICQMCFRQPGHLQTHKFRHTGEKPYQCEICKRCFRQSQSLKRHNLIHTGEKPYQCNVCKMCFSESGNLKKHNLKHIGEKPHQCDICKI